jgi:DNA-binding NtrC family response regulator
VHGEKKQILIADDEANIRRVLAAQLAKDGYEVHTAEDGRAAMDVLAEHHVDVVITDLRMPRVDGMQLLAHVASTLPDVPVIMITAHGTVDTAVEALKLGAFDYVTKPFERAELRNVVAKAARTRELAERDVATAPVGPPGPGRFRLIGDAPVMREIYTVVDKVADTPSTVLITGESGTGKELIARALHESSSRRDQPFIRVNCAAIPRDLMESELFGYEKGAFTGAATSKPGRFELAHGGTLFLDEIGEIPVSMQVKLLRALQEHEIERVGGIKTIRVDVRVVAATNRDLAAEIAKGTFREDLYYRLNVVHVHLPPLRERKSDIPLLVDHFLRRFNERFRKQVRGVDDASMEALLAHPWRGNIRELENVIERCTLFCEGDRITLEDLPPEVRRAASAAATAAGTGPATAMAPGAAPGGHGDLASDARGSTPVDTRAVVAGEAASASDPGVGLKEAVREAAARVERELIQRALRQTGGNVTHTARLLKISRKGLQMKMKELGLREGN